MELPGPNPPLLATWKGSTCWCCGTRFANDAGVILSPVNEHHVVPRACGGTNGPTVSLTAEHHDTLHAIATAVLNGKPWQHLCAAFPTASRNRLLYLARVVVDATRNTRNDPNQRFLLTGELPGVTGRRLKQLAHYYGVSQNKAIQILIDLEHARLFP